MTSKNELISEMARAGDTGESLSEELGISNVTFSAKLNGKSCFTQKEVKYISNKYNLSAERVMEIFFN